MKRIIAIVALVVTGLFGVSTASADEAAAGPVNHFCC